MAAALRRLSAGTLAARGAGVLLFALPLAAAVPLALAEAADLAAWRALWADPQLPRAWALAVVSAVASTVLALVLALWLVGRLHGTPAWPRCSAWLAPMLAVPHAAFAIGLAWLLAPTGAFARALAPLLGWAAPPGWQTVNDPLALGLTLTLVLKELPFLLWNLVALLARPELAARLAAERRVAASMGYGARAWWWRAGVPQLLPLLAWPLLAVLAYGLTVVDLALIIGPGQPPTLAALAYADLQGADPARSARGAAAAVLLALTLAALVTIARAAGPALRAAMASWAGRGERPALRPARGGATTLLALAVLYAVVVGVLALLSVAGPWPFPQAWPTALTAAAWQQVGASAGTVAFTAALAAAATAIALALTIAWLEATPARWDARIGLVVLAPLVLPPLLLMTGLYRGALQLRLDGSVAGLVWGHALVVLPYVFIVLQPAWRDLDPRYRQTALALGRSRWAFRWQVQRRLLAAPIAAAAAVGFAVSVGQFLATQMLGAGRHPTVSTEAVTLASGGDRRTAAAYALLQAVLPLLAFAVARRRAP
jgi:putative thiamine transport system permease protein